MKLDLIGRWDYGTVREKYFQCLYGEVGNAD